MKPKYTLAFKQQAVKKALSRSEGVTLRAIAEQLGVGYSTLEQWIRLSHAQQLDLSIDSTEEESSPMTPERKPQQWSLQERLEMVIACGSLDEEAISQRCREQGLYPHHVAQWKADFANGISENNTASSKSELKQLRHENKSLKRELNRKEKALAETAALLVLQKKVHAIWGTDEGNSP